MSYKVANQYIFIPLVFEETCTREGSYCCQAELDMFLIQQLNIYQVVFLVGVLPAEHWVHKEQRLQLSFTLRPQQMLQINQ